MSMSAFLFAADALRIEEGVSFHVKTDGGKPVSPREEIRKRNADAMSSFTAMMGGVQKRGRKR